MAAYKPRMGPNVSKFIASLNTLPAAEENTEDDFGIDEDDLKLFMHTEFLVDDFEDAQNNNASLGHPTLDASLDPIAPADFGRGRQPQQSESSDVVGGSNPANHDFDTVGLPALAAGGGHGDIKNLDFDDDFPLHGLPYMPQGNASVQNASFQNYGSSNQDFDLSFPSPTSPYALQNAGSPITPSPPNGMLPSPPNGMDPTPPNGMLPTPPNGKRAAATDPAILEANSRAAAEEDKRRRNTAASARFRVKKKQREQALEKTAKEMTDKCEQLEQKVVQLEMENKWLRGLVVEKTAKGGEEVAELWRKFKEEERSNKTAKKGVGTTEE